MGRAPWCSLVILALIASRSAAQAAEQSQCRIVCGPVITLMPALLRSHLFGGPRVENLATGERSRLSSSSNFEMIVAASSRTAIPRLAAFASVQWLPNASESKNPFTSYTARELGGPLHANAPTATVGLNGTGLTTQQTGGWGDLGANVGALFSQAARPGDQSSYTAKLDLELIAHVHAFNSMAPKTWAHRVSFFGILDYVATGLPRAGDEVPKGRVFLDNARPAALIVGLSLPITPEHR